MAEVEIIEDDFLGKPMKHRGAIKPPLPLIQGGISYPRSNNASTSLYSKAAPGFARGLRVADNIPLAFADWIERACNSHEDLVLAAKDAAIFIDEILKISKTPPSSSGVFIRLLAAIAKAEG